MFNDYLVLLILTIPSLYDIDGLVQENVIPVR